MDNHPEPIRVAVDSLGCKLNQAEIEYLARQLQSVGCRLVDPDAAPDVYILNTCTVTHIADRKSRHMLRLVRRRNPRVKLVAIGCYAERSPHELERIEGVDIVIGNDRKPDLVELLQDSEILPPSSQDSVPIYEKSPRTRSFIKVQDGCNNFCAFCIVPFVRSKLYSVPVDSVVAQIKESVTSGYREVVLTGTEIGTYSSEGADLSGLLERILDETDIARLRLSSLQPPEITPELTGQWRDTRLCPHFHISLQSGSDTVLKRMRRRYNTTGYRRAVTLIRDSVPDTAVTTDVIVGFPGETDAEFEESYDFCREMHFARIHVFPYSPRPGTAAAEMSGKIPDELKKQRSRKMLALAEESSRNFRQRYLGRTLEVLWEQKSGGMWTGYTGNYIRVYTKSPENLTNRITAVKLESLYRDGISGV